MAQTLRLPTETAAALRAAAERSGRSQQQLLREIVEAALGLRPAPDIDAKPALTPAKVPYRQVRARVTLPGGAHVADLIDRDDRW